MNAINMKKTHNPFKKIPWWGWVGAIIFIIFQIGLYKLACFFAMQIKDAFPNYPICPKIDPLDNGIKFCPYFFIEIYFLAYGFWFITPLWISTSRNKQNFLNFMIYSTIASFVGFFWLIAMPTYMDRVAEGLITPEGGAGPLVANIKTPVTKFLVQLIIAMDTGTTGWNLCPSYHCMASALCFFAVLKQKEHKQATQIGFGIMALLVCMATVLVKQHYFVDILGGVGVATIPYIITALAWKPGQRIMINNPLFLQTKKLTKRDVEKAEDANETTPIEKKEKIHKKK